MPGPPPKVSDKEILRMIVLSPDPIVTSGDIAENADMTRQAANKRLRDLSEKDLVRSRKVGSSAKVYWITEKGRTKIDD